MGDKSYPAIRLTSLQADKQIKQALGKRRPATQMAGKRVKARLYYFLLTVYFSHNMPEISYLSPHFRDNQCLQFRL
jgi:hypothetical protein